MAVSVTVNVCHDVTRKRRVSAPVEDAAELPALSADPQRTAIATERRHALEMSLRVLSEKERAVLVLRIWKGFRPKRWRGHWEPPRQPCARRSARRG